MTTEAATSLGSELSTKATIVPPERARQLARDHYDLDGQVEWLWGEKDSNYRLSLEDGRAYLLKILNPGEDPKVTDMHSRALLHVETVAPGIPVQRIIKTASGELDFRFCDEDGETRAVRMVSFLPGNAQKTSPHSPLQRRRVGHLMGQNASGSCDFHPRGHGSVS